MKNIGKYIIVSLCLLITSVNAGSFDSSYTSIKEADCKMINGDRMGAELSCASFSGIKVQLLEDDLRQSITLIRNGKPYPLDLWRTVSPAFSFLGSLIEWRYQKGKRNTPIGLITRFNASIEGEAANKTISYLAVAKITENEICVVGKIAPQAKQNEKARRMLAISSSMRCL